MAADEPGIAMGGDDRTLGRAHVGDDAVLRRMLEHRANGIRQRAHGDRHEGSPGSIEGLQMVVSDVNVARAELLERGVEVGEVQVFPWGSFVFFSDPDGNRWSVQQVPPR